MKNVDLNRVGIILNGEDNVVVAKSKILSGTRLLYRDIVVELRGDVEIGHRFALKNISGGEYLIQFGYPFAQSRGIVVGEPITQSNIVNILPDPSSLDFIGPPATQLKEKYLSKSFMGYKRKNGKIGTRNHFLVVPTSMCAGEVASQIALQLENNAEIIDRYSNIDGIVAIPHTEGCGCDSGLPIDRLLLVLKGYVGHPNVGGCLMVDLGCEQTNYEKVYAYFGKMLSDNPKPIDWITIQKTGGTRSTIRKAKEIIFSRLEEVNEIKRTKAPISSLVVGTECGASDSFSGISANPIIGNAVDKVIYGGGFAILSEMTELLGTYDMLLPRFRDLGVASKFQLLQKWYAELAKTMGLSLEPNLVPENVKGGLINNYIKSLGAAMKGGTTAIEDVVDYAEPVMQKGLTIMQGPGNDPESVTGLVAGGANIICFSTGKGTITGEAIVPVVKIASNSAVFKNLSEDMDFDGSRLLEDNSDIGYLGDELLEKILSVASGEKTWSEKWKQRQFQIWTAGKLSL